MKRLEVESITVRFKGGKGFTVPGDLVTYVIRENADGHSSRPRMMWEEHDINWTTNKREIPKES